MTGRLAKFSAAALGALVLLAVLVRPACSCSSKTPAYYSTMRADLRNLYDAQAQLFADSARYATTIEELQTLGLQVSPEVTLTLTPRNAAAWSASATHRLLFEVRCEIANTGGVTSLATVDGQPACDPPYKRKRWASRFF